METSNITLLSAPSSSEKTSDVKTIGLDPITMVNGLERYYANGMSTLNQTTTTSEPVVLSGPAISETSATSEVATSPVEMTSTFIDQQPGETQLSANPVIGDVSSSIPSVNYTTEVPVSQAEITVEKENTDEISDLAIKLVTAITKRIDALEREVAELKRETQHVEAPTTVTTNSTENTPTELQNISVSAEPVAYTESFPSIPIANPAEPEGPSYTGGLDTNLVDISNLLPPSTSTQQNSVSEPSGSAYTLTAA